MKGDLKLKREVIAKARVKPLADSSVAHIWVDSSVYHLDQEFSYAVPGNLEDRVSIGSLVSIPFHGRELTGVVVRRVKDESLDGLKSISKVIGTIPLLSPQLISLIAVAAQRYAAHPFDLIRSAVPDRIASIEREFASDVQEDAYLARDVSRTFLQLPPAQNRSELLARKIGELSQDGGLISVLPDSREVSNLHKELNRLKISHSILDSNLPKSEYFKNFLQVRTGHSRVVIGTRSAIFAPVSQLRSLLIYNDGSENFYEKRSPGWNVRDIALLRSRLESSDLYFTGYSPSAEVSRFVDEGWCVMKRVRAKLKVFVHQQAHGELIPSRSVPIIKRALANGPVLVLVPQKGYAQAIRCAQCKTISRCDCGGALEKKSERAPISCSHCLRQYPQWLCSWCHNSQPSLLGRGIDRHHLELGALFPGIPIQISTGDHRIDSEVSNGIIVATPGMAASTKSGYSALVIVEGNRFLNQPDLRSNERIREMYFAHASLVHQDGSIILVQDDGHSISTALSTWNPAIATGRELQERKDLSLPPYVRSATLTMEESEIVKLKNALVIARDEGRIPTSVKILGPIASGEKSSLILTAEVSEGDELVHTLHEFMRRRSASKKSLPSLRIDPYSLSH